MFVCMCDLDNVQKGQNQIQHPILSPKKCVIEGFLCFLQNNSYLIYLFGGHFELHNMAARGQISNVGRWILIGLGHNYTWFKPHKIAWK